MNLDLLDAWPPEKKQEWAARFRWRKDAHAFQIPPAEPWEILLTLAGRGSGKTRGAGQQAAEWMIDTPGFQLAVVAPTWKETRGVCLAGPAGIRAALRQMGYDPEYHKSDGIITLPNGSATLGYSSEKPDRLRGPEHHAAWCDELAVWKDAYLGMHEPDTTWSNLRLGLRLGERTRTLVTTTPKRVQLLRDLIDAGHPIQRASSFVNIRNLSSDFQAYIESLAGTTLGRQEVEGLMLDTVEGALWKDSWISHYQPTSRPSKTVVGVDPAGGRTGTTGIVVVQLHPSCVCGVPLAHGLVVEDASISGDPLTWANAVVTAARKWDAEIVAERNFGGEMVETTLRQIWPEAPLRLIVASGGGQGGSAKAFRAEPVAALYEAGRIHHTAGLIELEDQMTGWTPTDNWSPDRMDALVHAVTALGLTRAPQVVRSRAPWEKRDAVVSVST